MSGFLTAHRLEVRPPYMAVEIYAGAVFLWLEGERRRVRVRSFEHVTLASEAEARRSYMRLCREVEMLEANAAIELRRRRYG